VRVLVLNPGSSSLKATLLEPPERTPLAAFNVDWGSDATTVPDPAAAVTEAVAQANAVDAVGYRVVHGGDRFREPVLVDDAVEAAVADLADLAALHNAVAAQVIAAARAVLPAVPHVAVFDTAFHATLPVDALTYPVPRAWTEAWGIRRYGFHGISVQWSVRSAAETLGRPETALRLVVAHLGSGCSVTAVDGGRSGWTSMGMTPLEGLMMGTRAGSIDPGVILRVLERHGRPLDEVADALDHASGLAGVSGRGSDVRELLRAEADGDEAAALALGLFVRRAGEGIAAAATALPAVDALVFTGGIGEHAGSIRDRIVGRLAVLGFAPGEGPAVLVVPAREDVVIAEATARIAAGPGRRAPE
jgi:acetate kinase